MAQIRRIRLETYLKNHSQEELGGLFDLSQGWVSQIKSKHPEARLVEEDGEITAIEYAVKKVKYTVA